MSGKETALVVGAGTGLGWALVRCFAGAGMAVAAALRAPDKLSGLIDRLDGGARAYACDATDEGAVGELFKTVARDFGEPGLVIYNASAFVKKGLLETTV